MMKLNNTIAIAGLILMLLKLLLLPGCKKENKEVNYQSHVIVSENMLIAKHNVIQLTISYFQAIADSTLNASGGTHIDGGWTLKENNNPGVTYNFRYINNDNQSVGDAIGRQRFGIIEAVCDTLPLATGSQTYFDFTGFGFNKKPNLSYAEYPIINGSLTLKLLSTNDNRYEFESNISNLQFTDSTDTKTITLEGIIVYVWEKYKSSAYFSPDYERISIKEASLRLKHYTALEVEMMQNTSSHYPLISSKCGILKAGDWTLNFSEQDLGAAKLSYENIDTVCNKGTQMFMDAIPLRLTIDDWVIK